MNIKVHTHRCIGAGACAFAAPEVFDQDDQGIVVVRDPRPPSHLHASVHEAALACPAAAISVEQGDD